MILKCNYVAESAFLSGLHTLKQIAVQIYMTYARISRPCTIRLSDSTFHALYLCTPLAPPTHTYWRASARFKRTELILRHSDMLCICLLSQNNEIKKCATLSYLLLSLEDIVYLWSTNEQATDFSKVRSTLVDPIRDFDFLMRPVYFVNSD